VEVDAINLKFVRFFPSQLQMFSSFNNKTKMMKFFRFRNNRELSASDPLNSEVFPEEIQSAILSYLPVKDLLNATLVSKLWNDVIGSSIVFKRSIGIKLHLWSDEPTEIGNSDLSYEIVSVADFKMSSKKLDCLRDKNWRRVTLSIGSVPSQSKFVTIMSTFRAVKDLKVLSTNIGQLKGNPTIVLEDLETLVLSDVTLDLFDVLMVKQPSLRSLSMRFVITDVKSPKTVGEALTQFMNLNDTLRDLELNYIVTNDFFKVPAPQFPNLKLKNVTIGLNETKPKVCDNIAEFLRSQGPSIERLKLVLHQKFVKQESFHWRYWDVPEMQNDSDSKDINIVYSVWNSMTALNEINLRFLKTSTELPETLESREFMRSLKRNVNITSFNYQFMNVEAPASVIINIMKLAPNLQSIYVTKLSSAVVRYAAINLKALRSLKCFAFSDDCVQEYTQLKASQDEVNKFIVITDRCALG
jgi:hypothetical protein